MSKHIIEIVTIDNLHPHPNAEQLEITNIWGWTCCVPKGAFSLGDKAVYIPPDYVVPTDRPEFSFLKRGDRDVERITVKRFRGVLSQGLLIPVPKSISQLPVGTNVISNLGIVRYEELPPKTEGIIGGPPNLYTPKFDVESFQRYQKCFQNEEEVIVTEKIHGANARYVWLESKNHSGMFVGSRTNWWAEDEKNIFWKAFKRCPGILHFCRSNPNTILFGEVFGGGQPLNYGASKGDVYFAAFAGLYYHDWIDWANLARLCLFSGVPMVPHLFSGKFDIEKVYEMAEGDSWWPGANHLAEGVVVVPTKERVDPEIGRVCLKIVSSRYLSLQR